MRADAAMLGAPLTCKCTGFDQTLLIPTIAFDTQASNRLFTYHAAMPLLSASYGAHAL